MAEPNLAPATDPSSVADDAAVNEVVGRGPAGAFAVSGAATAIVVALYVAFYVYAYLPRGIVQ